MTRTVTPAEFDAEEFRAIQERDKAASRLDVLVTEAHRAAGDLKSYSGWGARRVTSWQLSDAEAVERLAVLPDNSGLLAAIVEAKLLISMLNGRIEDMERIWRAAPWSRYFPCLNADGHIHASLRGCSTVRWDTDMGWATELSGSTVEEAIAALGPTLCSVCFPGAPVAWCRSRQEVTRAEREAARAAKNAERDARLAVKNLTREESAQLSAAAGERVTTVAAAKALVRQPAETMAELEWNRSDEASSRWDDKTRYADFIARMEQRLARETNAAERAAEILAEREAAVPGTGQTREESDAAFTRKLRAARREWFR